HFPKTPVVQLRKDYSYALTFYLQSPVMTIDSLEQLSQVPYSSYLLYAPESEAEKISEEKSVPVKKEFDYFPVSTLSGKFINYETRKQSLGQFSLVLMGDQGLHAQQSGE